MLTEAFQISDEYVWVKKNGSEYRLKASGIKEGDIVVVRFRREHRVQKGE